MEALGALEPGVERVTGHRLVLERALGHELAPLGQRTHLLEHVGVVGHLCRRGARRGEDAAQHEVLHRNAKRHAGGQVGPGRGGGDLVAVVERAAVEDAQRAQLALAPELLAFDGVVHRHVHFACGQGAGDVATALERHIAHARGGRGLQQHRHELILLLAAGAAEAQAATRRLPHLRHQFARRAHGRVGAHPQQELVLREHLHGGQFGPAEVSACGQWRGEQIRQRDDQLVRVATRGLHVEQALGPRVAGPVDDLDRLLHQLVLGDQLGQQSRHLVGTAAGYIRFFTWNLSW